MSKRPTDPALREALGHYFPAPESGLQPAYNEPTKSLQPAYSEPTTGPQEADKGPTSGLQGARRRFHAPDRIRLDQADRDALARLVEAGEAESMSAAIRAAVREWIRKRGG